MLVVCMEKVDVQRIINNVFQLMLKALLTVGGVSI